MSQDEEELGESVERVLQNAVFNPIPHDLKKAIEDQIEPYTINAYMKHSDAMTCVEIAYPLIRDYLLAETE